MGGTEQRVVGDEGHPMEQLDRIGGPDRGQGVRGCTQLGQLVVALVAQLSMDP